MRALLVSLLLIAATPALAVEDFESFRIGATLPGFGVPGDGIYTQGTVVDLGDSHGHVLALAAGTSSLGIITRFDLFSHRCGDRFVCSTRVDFDILGTNPDPPLPFGTNLPLDTWVHRSIGGAFNGGYLFKYYADLFIDNVSVTQFQLEVPEPATWSLMIAGFGLTGTALRRRQAIDAVKQRC